MSIQWRNDLSVGVSEIDNQHKELINAINSLFDACSAGKGKEEVGKVIEFLGDYVIKHFGAEEKLQIKYEYPKYTAHKAQHEQFIKNFLEFKKEFEEKGPNLNFTLTINRVITDWLVQHIYKTDKELGNYLKDKI